MPKVAQVLTAQQVKSIKKTGQHAVGGVPGLCLQVTASNQTHVHISRSWLLRYTFAGKRKNMGLGAYDQLLLSEAREAARLALRLLHQGVDPVVSRKAAKLKFVNDQIKAKTFKECARDYMAAHLPKHRNVKHQKQWESTLRQYAFPKIGDLPVGELETSHILAVLQQTTIKDGRKGTFWQVKTETAKRLRGRIENILAFADVAGYRSGKNPAEWKNHLETQLPSPAKIMRLSHQPAMPYLECGAFIKTLRKKNVIGAQALEFLVLTGVRSGSVREANWDEVDLVEQVWTIPAPHTKSDREHRVPLVGQTIALLNSLPRIANVDKIFPGKRGGALSDSTLSKLMREMRDAGEFTSEGVPHGFRSSFRDWGAEQTSYPEELRKVATMHVVGDAVQQAYQRTDLLEKRRQLMKDWADYLDR
jgi:integrase